MKHLLTLPTDPSASGSSRLAAPSYTVPVTTNGTVATMAGRWIDGTKRCRTAFATLIAPDRLRGGLT